MSKMKKVRIPLIIASVVLGLYGLSLLYPLVWGIMISLKKPLDYFRDMISFPKPPQFSNYLQAFQELNDEGSGLIVMIWNSTRKCPAPSMNADSAYPQSTPLKNAYEITKVEPNAENAVTSVSGLSNKPSASDTFNAEGSEPIMGTIIVMTAIQ